MQQPEVFDFFMTMAQSYAMLEARAASEGDTKRVEKYQGLRDEALEQAGASAVDVTIPSNGGLEHEYAYSGYWLLAV